MDLFSDYSQAFTTILPYDGEVDYYGIVLNKQQSDFYYTQLMSDIEWQNDQAVIFGKKVITKRKVAWYGDIAFNYTYSNITKTALAWTEDLLALKKFVEEKTGETYNSCLLNLYHSGQEGMTWHSDAEKDLKKHGAIASVSFGAVRKFAFKHKENGVKIDVVLDHGSLLVMKGNTQENWLHRLAPTKLVHTPRINLTFRTIEIKE
ncbi:alpha-ketoglutarate-dependent dioxygenase AlkB [Myroides sp. M-43]|uniref:alpha-ketoglutarate-dependent dioxygenase AlkB family protein n=1 Tax=Myroides oncorhynchi TaxID=2893756 RepID=UPI001E2AA851|nr:alpha-ketoglutarate-dependent dioxygenase AlkB [Myroides oncorhynchi]MCC9043240.1 alpha-ketoglutarate-dependent dioxygenase AlkB [Myroides oncorhynchi]